MQDFHNFLSILFNFHWFDIIDWVGEYNLSFPLKYVWDRESSRGRGGESLSRDQQSLMRIVIIMTFSFARDRTTTYISYRKKRDVSSYIPVSFVFLRSSTLRLYSPLFAYIGTWWGERHLLPTDVRRSSLSSSPWGITL